MSIKKGLVIILISSVFPFYVFSQKDYVDADGIIEYHNRIPLTGATLKLYSGNQLIETITTGETGEYHFKLEYNKEYLLEISKGDLITKRVKYNTMMPPKIRGSWWIGIPINLYEACPGLDASVFKDPVAVVEFNERKKEYRANPDHDDRMRDRIRAFENANDDCLDSEFVKLVRKADELYDQKKYEEARELYEDANEKRPWEFHSGERLEEIDNKVAQQNASSNVFDNMVAQGDKLLEEGNLIAAKNAYKRALVVKPSDTYARGKITEIDKSLRDAATDQQQQIQSDNQYEQIITQADRAMQTNNLTLAERFYSQALEIKPNVSYPTTQLSKIKTQISREQKQKELYTQKISIADAYLSQFKYEQAKASYLEAQQILPNETYPSQKINEIEETLKRDRLLAQREAKEKEEKEFNNLLTQADNAFNSEDYQTAKSTYEKILEIKPYDNYSKQRLSKIEKILADKEKEQKQNELEYNKAISAGNLFLQQKKYELAKNEYNKAIALNPDEVLPKTQIIKINQILEQEEQRKQADQQKDIEYRTAMTSGESYKSQGNFDAAKTAFNKALTIKANDPLAQSKLNEIDNLEQQQQQLAQQKQVDEQYMAEIRAGNQFLEQENYEGAKQKFQEASKLKPGESLPNEKLQQIERLEQEKARTLALEKTREEAYQKALKEGADAFVAKDYFNARNMYNQALKYKPNDVLATSKLQEVNSAIEAQKQQQQALEEKDRKYNEFIAEADRLLGSKDYTNAKNNYNSALALKSEAYPRNQVEKINEILTLEEEKRQAELERENDFLQARNKADGLYTKKDYYNAKEMYEAALTIKPEDEYSKTRLKNISTLIEKLEANKSNTTTKTVAVKTQTSAILPELKFKDDAELELYLIELRNMYPEGITHEIYTGEREVMDRYIIIRQNETKEFRKVHYSWGGNEYWINDKPCTSMYFESQTKQRTGEYYNKVEK